MSIVWSGVLRGTRNQNTVIAEAGEDNYNGEVVALAQKLINKKQTAGWEYEKNRKVGLTGIKFHVFDHNENEANKEIVWSFAAVSEKKLEEDQVKSFLEKLVYITVPWRESQEWREGQVLVGQEQFAPILKQKMDQVASQGRLAMVNETIDTTKEIMAENIEMALERHEKLEELDQKAEDMSAMAKQFKKRAKQVKRFKMMQDAKHGLIVGTAITGVVAVVTIPPLIALL